MDSNRTSKKENRHNYHLLSRYTVPGAHGNLPDHKDNNKRMHRAYYGQSAKGFTSNNLLDPYDNPVRKVFLC